MIYRTVLNVCGFHVFCSLMITVIICKCKCIFAKKDSHLNKKFKDKFYIYLFFNYWIPHPQDYLGKAALWGDKWFSDQWKLPIQINCLYRQVN